MSNIQPVVFLSHGGGPSYYISAETRPVFKGMDKDSKAADFLRNFTKTVKLNVKPEAILVVSAHWETDEVTANTNSKHSLYYDYNNFPPETYQLKWPVVGSPDVARKAMDVLKTKGFKCQEDSKRGLDHGVFIPLKLVFPEADIPGFDVYDDCQLPQRTMSRALDVLDGHILGSPSCTENTTCQIGIIGSSNSITTESLLYAVKGTQLPLFGPYASFPELARYNNFYRTIPNDDQQILAVLHVLKQLELTYVAVVNTNDAYGEYSAQQLKTLGKQHGICVDVTESLELGRDVNKTKLIEQRQRTKDNSLYVVYFGTRDVFRLMLSELKHSANEIFNISWLVVERGEDTSDPFDLSTDSLQNGTLVISNSQVRVGEAVEFVNNKWAKIFSGDIPSDPIEELVHCLDDMSVRPWSDTHTASTIDAIFVLISAFQRQLMVLCPESDTNVVCSQIRENFDFNLHKEVLLHPIIYKDMPIRVDEFVTSSRIVNFTANGNLLLDAESALFDVFLVTSPNSLEKIGIYKSNAIEMNNTSSLAQITGTSRCGPTCPVCDDAPTIPFAFLEGDTYLLGIVSIHETDPVFPFKCSKFRTSQMDVVMVEAILHTVEAVRAETNITYGVVILDDCYSSARIELILTQIMSRTVALLNPNTGEPLDVSKIAAVITTVGSSVTIAVSQLMTELNRPIISSTATSPDLDDRINNPYFLRTVPSDVEQAKAMGEIVKKMNWKYISVLYVKNNYGTRGKDMIIDIAKNSGICVAEFPEGIPDVATTNDDLKEVATRISNHQTDVVIYFGTDTMISQFLSATSRGDYIFLASEDWGDRQFILDEAGDRTLGSITMKNVINTLNDDSFTNHLKSANPKTISRQRNPWFAEFWEESFKCDLSDSFANKYDKQCDESKAFDDTNIDDLINNQRSLNVIEAVRAVAVGLTTAKDGYCKFENTFPCPAYFQYIEDVVTILRKVSLKRGEEEKRIFKEDGNGNIGFRINNVQRDGNGKPYYKDVGSYDDGFLNLKVDSLHFYRDNMDGACVGTLCDHCGNGSKTLPTTSTTTHAPPDEPEFSIADYTLIGIMGFIVLIIVIPCIIIVCYFKKRVTDLENHIKEAKYEIRTGAYTSHNGSAFTAARSMSMNYPEMTFVNNGPSEEEFRAASYALKNGGVGNDGQLVNGGIVNRGFVGNEMYIHPRHDDNENDVSASSGKIKTSSRRSKSSAEQSSSGSYPESPVYKPSSSSYGLSSHSSFKKTDNPHNSHNSQIKKQPRTQLAVPPCRPELPPRDNSGQPKLSERPPNVFPEQFENMSPTVPKDKVRNGKSNHKRTVLPPSYKYNPPTGKAPHYREPLGGKNSLPSNGFVYNPNRSPTEAINLSGSIEKISRV